MWHQPVLAGEDLDERAEFLDRGHAAFVDPADLHALGHRDDLVAGRLGAGGLAARERHHAASSMSILAPVSSWSRRIVLPPGPMTRPIFSGLIWIWINRGAIGRDLVARAA